MRTTLAELLLASCFVPASVAVVKTTTEPDSPFERACAYFATLPPGDTKAILDMVRPHPIDPASKARALNRLPPEGELTPNPDEAAKLERIVPILVYHDRHGIVDTKVIDVPLGAIALYARSVLLASREALRVLSVAELQALVAHEMGHEYFWDAYERARENQDVGAVQEVELKCDGIAAITLKELGYDPFRLTAAARKLTQFNEARAATANALNYPSLTDRNRFVKRVLALWSSRHKWQSSADAKLSRLESKDLQSRGCPTLRDPTPLGRNTYRTR
jgi:hypothetical protein